MYGEIATKTLLTLGGKPQAWTKQLPDYNQWRKFTVDDVDPIKRGLKRIDNALSAIDLLEKIRRPLCLLKDLLVEI